MVLAYWKSYINIFLKAIWLNKMLNDLHVYPAIHVKWWSHATRVEWWTRVLQPILNDGSQSCSPFWMMDLSHATHVKWWTQVMLPILNDGDESCNPFWMMDRSLATNDKWWTHVMQPIFSDEPKSCNLCWMMDPCHRFLVGDLCVFGCSFWQCIMFITILVVFVMV